MASVAGEVTALVVGAGAAGLACARRLASAGVEVQVLEARERVGGRVWTWSGVAPHPVELGAEFVHGERSLVADLARLFGLKMLDVPPGDEVPVYADGRALGLEGSSLLPGVEVLAAYGELAAAWAESAEGDVSLRRALILEAGRQGLRWSAEVSALLDALVSVERGASPDAVSARSVGEGVWEDGWAQRRLAGGYGGLMERLASGVSIRFGAAAEVVRWGEGGVEVACADGAVHRARWGVVTAPLGVLQAGGVRFEPGLPASVQAAVEGLGVGAVNKVVLRFSAPPWPAEEPGLLTPLRVQHWWRPGWGRSDEAPVAMGLVAGEEALALDRLGEARAVEAALGDAVRCWGLEARRRFVSGRWVSWTGDPWSRMGYSYVPVGGAGLREALGQPIGALQLAGEATSPGRAATVQGALESGERAAEVILQASGLRGRGGSRPPGWPR